jgi:hypothetical protein
MKGLNPRVKQQRPLFIADGSVPRTSPFAQRRTGMRTLDAIDAELRLLGAVRAAPGDSGGQPTMMAVSTATEN